MRQRQVSAHTCVIKLQLIHLLTGRGLLHTHTRKNAARCEHHPSILHPLQYQPNYRRLWDRTTIPDIGTLMLGRILPALAAANTENVILIVLLRPPGSPIRYTVLSRCFMLQRHICYSLFELTDQVVLWSIRGFEQLH